MTDSINQSSRRRWSIMSILRITFVSSLAIYVIWIFITLLIHWPVSMTSKCSTQALKGKSKAEVIQLLGEPDVGANRMLKPGDTWIPDRDGPYYIAYEGY